MIVRFGNYCHYDGNGCHNMFSNKGNDVTIVKKSEVEKIKLGGFLSLKEVMDQAVKAGFKLMMCEQSCMWLSILRVTSH
jgi:predicted peroxiredoxin